MNVGYSKSGRRLLKKMAKSTSCGHAWQAAEISSPEGMEAMVREIFFEEGKIPAPPIHADYRILINNVLFDSDKAVLKPEGKAELDKVVREMKEHPSDTVVLHGHTCDLGSAERNMKLGERRAETAKAYLVEQGIDGSRVTTMSHGESQPAVPNDGPANRKLNRRVEIEYVYGN